MEILAERIVTESVINYALAVISLIGIIFATVVIFFSTVSRSFKELDGMCAFLIMLAVFVLFFISIVGFISSHKKKIESNQYLIKINESTTYEEFTGKYEVKEQVAEDLFWCSEINE